VGSAAYKWCGAGQSGAPILCKKNHLQGLSFTFLMEIAVFFFTLQLQKNYCYSATARSPLTEFSAFFS
jgi:hypothetical protein